MVKKILFASANPSDTSKLDLETEARDIQQALKLSKNRDDFEIFTCLAIRVEDLRRALLEHQPNIVHFSGHGTTEGLLLLDNSGLTQVVSKSALSSLFENFRGLVECVLLNACYSKAQAEAIYRHVDCVIGMNQPIEDTSAINFAIGFYDAVFSGESYHYAFNFALSSMQLEGSEEHLTPEILFRPTQSNILKKDNMSPEKSQSQYNQIQQKMSDGTMYGGMIATQGNNNQQTMNTNVAPSNQEKQITQAEAIQLLGKIEQLIQNAADLPEADKQNSLMFLQPAKALSQHKEPNKQLISGNLKQVADTLANANQAVVSTKSLWTNVKPILQQLVTWLGVAHNYFGF